MISERKSTSCNCIFMGLQEGRSNSKQAGKTILFQSQILKCFSLKNLRSQKSNNEIFVQTKNVSHFLCFQSLDINLVWVATLLRACKSPDTVAKLCWSISIFYIESYWNNANYQKNLATLTPDQPTFITVSRLFTSAAKNDRAVQTKRNSVFMKTVAIT